MIGSIQSDDRIKLAELIGKETTVVIDPGVADPAALAVAIAEKQSRANAPLERDPVTGKIKRTFSGRLQVALARAARAALPCNAHADTPIPVLASADPQAPDFLSDRAMFDSARRAVRFAVTRDGNPSRPFFSRFLDKTTLVGLNSSGLSVLDAAAQAGIILALVVRHLGQVPTAALIASCSPQTVPCNCRRPCCSGKRVYAQWRYAIDTLTCAALEVTGPRANSRLRSALVLKIYGHGKLIDIANALEVDIDTVSKHHKRLLQWLQGSRGKGGEEGVEGLESRAWVEAESVLRDHRIVA